GMAIDPFTGGSFMYRTQAQSGFQLYSMGMDRSDDGGRLPTPHTSGGDLLPIDLKALPEMMRPKPPQTQTPPIWLR
ncbi:MAG: hypothetical protein RMK45_08315, partial [Armatimonadota bacterium]|nr:hypothetical protein [Armatimonadota bacterium]